MPSIKLNDMDLFYSEDGEGKPILFIHGLGANHQMFEPQIASFKSTYRVICPDTRGNGNSGILSGPVSTVLDRQCDDIAALLDHLKITKAIFCGVSYGGVFCQHFALRYPNRVAGMVISDSFGDTKIHSIQEAFLMASQYANLWAYYVPKMLAPSVKWQYQKWPLAQKYMVDAFENMRSHEVLLQRLAINQANHTKDLSNVSCQVLGIVGDYSKILIQYMQRMISALPNGRLEIIHDSFDPSNLCQQGTYDRLIKEFLSDIEW
jgi:3-oxoadipate enol-lactonase